MDVLVLQKDQELYDQDNVTHSIFVNNVGQVSEIPVLPAFVYHSADILNEICLSYGNVLVYEMLSIFKSSDFHSETY